MKHERRGRVSRLIGWTVLLALLVAAPARVAAEDGPTFDGKSVEEWVEVIESEDREAFQALAKGGVDAHPVLRALLGHDDVSIVRAALGIIVKSREACAPLVPDLIALTRREKLEIRGLAIGALGAFPDHELTRPALSRALEDAHIRIRLIALGRLTEMHVSVPRAAVILTEGLAATDPIERCLAASICGFLGDRAEFAVPRLLELLRAKESRVVLAAASSLLRLDREIEATLRTLYVGLRHPTRKGRMMTAFMVSLLGEAAQSAAPLALEHLSAADSATRRGALEFLLYTGVEPGAAADALLEALTGEDAEERTYFRALCQMGFSPIAPAVLAQLGQRVLDDEPGARRVAEELPPSLLASALPAETLVRAGLSRDPIASARAIAILEFKREDERAAALDAMGSELRDALTGPGPRTGARRLLHGLESADALPLLLGLLRVEDAEVRAHAAYALALICRTEKRTAPALRSLLDDERALVRREALLALLSLETRAETPIEGLPDLLQDRDPGVRAYAGAALAAVGTPDAPSFDEQSFEWWLEVFRRQPFGLPFRMSRKLEKGGKAVLPLLRALRQHSDASVRRKAVSVLGDLAGQMGLTERKLVAAISGRDPDELVDLVVPELAVALRDPDHWVRGDAAEALDDCPEHSLATALLERSLDDPDSSTSTAASLALAKGGVPPDRILAVLALSLHEEHGVSALEAIEATGHLGVHARPLVPEIVRRFETERDYEQTVCAIALGRIGAHVDRVFAHAVGALADQTEDRRGVGREILTALGERGRRAAAPFVAMLDGPDDLERLRAVQILLCIELESRRAVELLYEARRSPQAAVRERAEEAFGDWRHLPPPGLVRGLIARLESEDPDVLLETIGMMGGFLGVTEFAPAMVRMLSHPDARIRKAAEKCVIGLPREAVLPLMEDLAYSGAGPGVEVARRYLEIFGGRAPAPPEPKKSWAEILRNGTTGERIEAIKEIADSDPITPEIRAALEKCLEDPSVSIRYYAKKALKKIRAREKK